MCSFLGVATLTNPPVGKPIARGSSRDLWFGAFQRMHRRVRGGRERGAAAGKANSTLR